MEKYKILERLGEGAFGKVYKALNKSTGEIVAIKKFEQKYKTREECLELRQVKSLQRLKHPNITKLEQVLQQGDELYLVFEYLEVNLFEYYSKRKQADKPFSEKQLKCMVLQILEGLAHMHKNGFFHRDMKPENVLIIGNTTKLCDFGLAREIRSMPPFTQYVSTRWYRAPQLLLSSTNYNSPVDIFALGCIIVELYTFNPLFAGHNPIDQMNKIVQVLGTPDSENWADGYKLAKRRNYYFPAEKKQNLAKLIPNASSEAIDLIEQTLQYNPKKRPKASELLKHPFFDGIINNSQVTGEEKKKEIVFNQNLLARPVPTDKHDKKHQFMRLTKEKFFRDTNQKWGKQNFDMPAKKQQKQEQQDLQAILKQLQKQQQQKKVRNSVKQQSNKPPMQMRESKTEMGYVNPFKQQKQPWLKKSYDTKSPLVSYHKQRQKQKQQPVVVDFLSKKLNYSFQPAPLFPFTLKPISKFESYGRPPMKSNTYDPIGVQPMYGNPRTNIFKSQGMGAVPKARSELNYKYKF